MDMDTKICWRFKVALKLMILIFDKSTEKKKNLKGSTRTYFMCQSLSIEIFFLFSCLYIIYCLVRK